MRTLRPPSSPTCAQGRGFAHGPAARPLQLNARRIRPSSTRMTSNRIASPGAALPAGPPHPARRPSLPVVFLPAPAAGQDATALKRLALEDLMEVDVTSVSRRTEPLSEAPAAVYVITRRRHPALRRHELAGGAAPGDRPAGRARRRDHLGDQRARLQQHAGEQAARADRRAHRLHAAVLGRVLGRPGHAARGRRPHRGHPRSRRRRSGAPTRSTA